MTVAAYPHTDTLAHMTYTYHAEGHIHMLTFHENTRAAVDELVRVLDTLYENISEDDTFYLLVDYRESGIPPIHHIIRKAGGWARSLDVHPTAYMAIITNADFTTTLLNTLLRTLNFGHLTTRFFKGEHGADNALNWLRSS